MPIADHAHPSTRTPSPPPGPTSSRRRTPTASAGSWRCCATRPAPRILFALVAVDELCGGGGAAARVRSVDPTSYGRRARRHAGRVTSRRDGRVIYYRLTEGFPHQLLEHCLLQLLSISTKES